MLYWEILTTIIFRRTNLLLYRWVSSLAYILCFCKEKANFVCFLVNITSLVQPGGMPIHRFVYDNWWERSTSGGGRTHGSLDMLLVVTHLLIASCAGCRLQGMAFGCDMWACCKTTPTSSLEKFGFVDVTHIIKAAWGAKCKVLHKENQSVIVTSQQWIVADAVLIKGVIN